VGTVQAETQSRVERRKAALAAGGRIDEKGLGSANLARVNR